jgi:hypothetical protein
MKTITIDIGEALYQRVVKENTKKHLLWCKLESSYPIFLLKVIILNNNQKYLCSLLMIQLKSSIS